MKRKIIAVLLLTVSLTFSGCKKADTENVAASEASNSTAAKSTDTQSSTQSSEDTSGMFTDRDKEIGYDEENSAKIQLSENGTTCDSDAVSISGNTVTITDEGTYILSGSLSDGMVIVAAEDTDKVQIVLDGVNITSSASAAIYVRSADKVFLTTAAGSENTLTNGGTYTAIDENNIDAVIFSKSDLTLNGAGTLKITAQAGHGIVSKDDLVLTSGTYEINAEKHGLSGKDSVRIADGTYAITCGKDGIHSSNSEDESKGFVYLAGGKFEITAGDDGVHADSALTITNGTIQINESYEGLEGKSIDIASGEITLTASDDGLNAAGGADGSGFEGAGGDQFSAGEDGVYIQISGGILHVNASGDGIDSNGDLTVSGGETYVSGPVDSGNVALDYNGEAVINGGIFVAAGSVGMAQNFDSSSTQGAMLVTVDSQNAGSTVSLTDSSGKNLVSWTPDKSYSSVVISCPEITQGETYTLTAGNETQQITMDSLIYGRGTMEGPGGGQMNGRERENLQGR